MKKNKTNLILIAIITLVLGALPNIHLFAETATVLERVRKVEDPELAEIIEIAKNNYPRISTTGLNNEIFYRIEYENKIGLSKAIRTATEKYAQIKLLDKKIELLEEKTKPEQNEDIKSEFMITKSSLESERLKCIAELREALNLTPWTPFGAKEMQELHTHLHFEVLDDSIRIFTRIPRKSSKSFNLMNLQETAKYIENIIEDSNNLPIRFTFAATEKGDALARDLQGNIKTMIHNMGIEYETDFRTLIGRVEGYVLRVVHYGPDRIIQHYLGGAGRTIPRADYRPGHFGNTLYSVDEYLGRIKAIIQSYDYLPLVIEIESCSEVLQDDNAKLISGLNKAIKEQGLEKFVQIKNNHEPPTQ